MAKSKSSKPTKQASPIDVEARVKKLTRDAQSAIAMREKLNIRFTEDEIHRIQKAAEQSKKRVMPMLRKWVLDALENFESEQEIAKTGGAASPVARNIGSIYVQEKLEPQTGISYDQPILSSVEARLSALESLTAKIAAQMNIEKKY